MPWLRTHFCTDLGVTDMYNTGWDDRVQRALVVSKTAQQRRFACDARRAVSCSLNLTSNLVVGIIGVRVVRGISEQSFFASSFVPSHIILSANFVRVA